MGFTRKRDIGSDFAVDFGRSLNNFGGSDFDGGFDRSLSDFDEAILVGDFGAATLVAPLVAAPLVQRFW